MENTMETTQTKIPVGISACLMGDEVRFNGGHKQSRYCRNVLTDFFEFKKFCPEVAIGMSIPREPIRLFGENDKPKAIGTVDPDLDVTEPLLAQGKVVADAMPEICGYILMKGSPSCGMERVKVYKHNGHVEREGQGLFVTALLEQMPNLPIEEDGRLTDPILRENFINRVYVYSAWREFVANEPTLHGVLQFHTRHKYMLMANSYAGYRELGRYLAQAHDKPLEEVLEHYISRLMVHLTKRAKRSGHTNVLMHILGYLKKQVDSASRASMLETIHQYRRGEVHLAVPIALLNHYINQVGADYIRDQVYLDPYPKVLGLRNYI